MDTVVEYGRVRLRPTARGDIENLVAFEQDPANAPFIRLWTPAQHEAGIANPQCILRNGDMRLFFAGELVGEELKVSYSWYALRS